MNTRLLMLRVTLETDDGALIHMTFTGGPGRPVHTIEEIL